MLRDHLRHFPAAFGHSTYFAIATASEAKRLANSAIFLDNFTGLELSIWNDLTDLTLSRCPTLSLEKFNQFMNRLTNLKILNLYHMFPAPPKGCAR